MKLYLVVSTVYGLIALCSSATEPEPESKPLTKLTPMGDPQPSYAGDVDDTKDLTPSASDRTFHVNKDYGSIGYPGGYPGRYPGGYPEGYPGGYPGGYGGSSGYPGIGGYPGTSYRGGIIPGYRGYQVLVPGLGGGYLGYGYYDGYPAYIGYNGYGGYGGYGGYRGYGDYGLRGYGGYGSYGTGYEDNYLGYGQRGPGRYDGAPGYDYGDGYGANRGSSYASRNPNYPNSGRGSYGTSLANPSGYRGYS
ncbi:prisilkin-39 [Harpegnathos saltator]|uniref:prisilkin-39 n=1 Tax=Harpegnathos saltator TaxID=610380 RepID=UPI00058D2011|nr:prisilkin-39 [Harpegnathos saltator]